jgi:hypothetical protein
MLADGCEKQRHSYRGYGSGTACTARAVPAHILALTFADGKTLCGAAALGYPTKGDGRCGELRDRNVIRVPVSTLGSECHDDLGMDSSNMLNDGSNSFARVCVIEMLVAEIKQ